VLFLSAAERQNKIEQNNRNLYIGYGEKHKYVKYVKYVKDKYVKVAMKK